MKIAISADWHLDNMKRTYLIDGKPNREIDLDRQVNYMVSECVKREVKIFFVAGDLFDKNYVVGYFFDKAMNYLREFTARGIKVIVIPGNHELKEVGVPITNTIFQLRDKLIETWYDVTLLEKHVIGCEVDILLIPHIRYGQIFEGFESFTEYIEEEDFLELGKGRRIIIGHFQPEGTIPGSEQEMFSGSTRMINSRIFKSSLVFCGHVHKPQNKGNVYVVGSPVRFNLAERKEEKRFIIYDAKTNKVESVELKCQKIILVKVDLYNKNVLNLSDKDTSKLKKFKNSMIYMRAEASKKNSHLINIGLIKEIFEKVNAKIVSYKMEIIKGQKIDKEKKTEGKLSMLPDKIFLRILNKKVKDKDTKVRIKRIGFKLLGEVSD